MNLQIMFLSSNNDCRVNSLFEPVFSRKRGGGGLVASRPQRSEPPYPATGGTDTLRHEITTFLIVSEKRRETPAASGFARYVQGISGSKPELLYRAAKKPTPEELTAETIEDSLDFSLEYLTRYEEEVNRNKEALQEKEHLLQVLSDQKDRVISEKDDALAEKEQLIQAQQDRNAELEAELAEYHRKDKEKEQKRINRKKIVHLAFGIIWKLVVVALLVIIAAWICSKVNAAYTNAVGIVVGLIGAIPVVVSLLKSDLKKYKSNGAEEGTSEE